MRRKNQVFTWKITNKLLEVELSSFFQTKHLIVYS